MFRNKNSDKRFKQTVNWLIDHHLHFEVISKENLTSSLIKSILELSDQGFEGILVQSNEKNVTRFLKDVDFEDLSLEELILVILRCPDLLKSPIIFDTTKIQIGFNSDEIRKFIPTEKRIISRKKYYG
ncbi:ArsC/Spx/MgsR family protein [Lactococcus lactis]|uniref:ArsC/Spx/MgsR family protein n=1 Tax=Lactococcus lactis TaxID=1358 RepID=UPI00223B7DBA|nr:ArsC/Spx/MgsR family protein [Lactococcus lactis]